MQTRVVEPLPPRKTPALVAFYRAATSAQVVGWTVLLVALALSYVPTFSSLIERWISDDNYNYGFLVVPIAAFILWNRRDLLPKLGADFKPVWPALGVVVVLLLARYWLYERNEGYLENLTFLPVIVASTLLFGGWAMLRFAWPAIAFLIFMYPLPERLNGLLSYNLQSFATTASCSILQMIGRPAIYEGNIILIPGYTLEVARACSGLSMLLTFVALITAMVIIDKNLSLWQRIVLLISSVPIALASNVIRIIVTALCYPIFGPIRVEKFAHDFAGWAMMPIGLLMAWAEIVLLEWLVDKEEIDDGVILPGLTSFKKAAASPRP